MPRAESNLVEKECFWLLVVRKYKEPFLPTLCFSSEPIADQMQDDQKKWCIDCNNKAFYGILFSNEMAWLRILGIISPQFGKNSPENPIGDDSSFNIHPSPT
jgi:hypothetical protein